MNKANNSITQKRLKELLIYNEITGEFFSKRTSRSTGHFYQGRRDKNYIRVQVDKKVYRAHRLAWLYVYGEHPSDEIDHINGNGLDNSISNLRVVTRLENCQNKKIGKNNKSGVIGVHLDKSGNRWIASIRGSSNKIYIGSFIYFWDAVCARKSMEFSLGYLTN